MQADPDGFVVGIIDVRDKAVGANPGTMSNWQPPMYHHPDWTAKRMGQVFGIATDRRGNIYVPATTSYGATFANYPDVAGPAGWGGIYRIDAFTGQVEDFVKTGNGANQIPNSGPGLGNLAYDPVFDQLLVTNFEDGKIYRITNLAAPFGAATLGLVGGSYDPFAADNGQAGYAPLGERLWGIGIHGGRVYFSVWKEDYTNRSTTAQNEVWSATLSGSGVSGAPKLEFSMTDTPIPPAFSDQRPFSNPVADIEFSSDGRMLLAERGMSDDTTPSAHLSRVLLANYVHPQWVLDAGFMPEIGAPHTKTNAAGGVDFAYNQVDPKDEAKRIGCERSFWATGDYLLELGSQPSTIVYGFQGAEFGKTTLADSYFVDFNYDSTKPWTYGIGDKTEVGDVDIFRDPCGEDGCVDFKTVTVECKDAIRGLYEVTVNFDYKYPFDFGTSTDAKWVFVNGTPIELMPPVSSPGAGSFTFPLTGNPGDAKTVTLQLHGEKTAEDYAWCCPKQDVQVVLPNCRCFDAQLISADRGRYRIQVTNFNITPDATYLLLDVLSPANTTVAPNAITLNPAPGPGQNWLSAPLAFTPAPAAGSFVRVRATLHGKKGANGVYEQCCIEEFELRVPRTFFSSDWPFTGHVYNDVNLDKFFNGRDTGIARQPILIRTQDGQVRRVVTDETGEFAVQGLRLRPGQLVQIELGPLAALPPQPRPVQRTIWPPRRTMVVKEQTQALDFAIQTTPLTASPGPGTNPASAATHRRSRSTFIRAAW